MACLDFKKLLFVGIDPHKDLHVAVMIDHWGEVYFELEFPNKLEGFKKLLSHVDLHTPVGKTAVFGIEDTGGLGRSCAQWLISQQRVVKGVNPIMSSSLRNRRPHRPKNDIIDAIMVAKVLIDDYGTLPVVREDEFYHALKQLVNRREQLVKLATQCKNRLHNLLHEHFSDYKEFFSNPFGITALAFWHKYPHPSMLQNVGTKRLTSFLQESSRNLSVSKANTILSLVDKNQPFKIDAEINTTIIRQLIEQLQQTQAHILKIEDLISELLRQSDIQLDTMPGVGLILAASIIARVGPIKRFSSADKLTRHAGIAPQDNSSGRSIRQQKAKSGDRQLNTAIHRIALNQIVTKNKVPRCPVAYEYYQRKIAEGKTRLSALTCLKRRLCDIIYAMLRDKSCYIEPTIVDKQELSVA